jgi:hypothetical protein
VEGSNSACVFWWGRELKHFLAKATFYLEFFLTFFGNGKWSVCESESKEREKKIAVKNGNKQLAESRYTPVLMKIYISHVRNLLCRFIFLQKAPQVPVVKLSSLRAVASINYNI